MQTRQIPSDFPKDFTYIKVIKLTTAAVTGTVDEISTDGKTVWINKTEYDLAKNMVGDVKNEDEGTFYIGMTGKIVDFEGSSCKQDCAYTLKLVSPLQHSQALGNSNS